jgi:hypothetical protein
MNKVGKKQNRKKDELRVEKYGVSDPSPHNSTSRDKLHLEPIVRQLFLESGAGKERKREKKQLEQLRATPASSGQKPTKKQKKSRKNRQARINLKFTLNQFLQHQFLSPFCVVFPAQKGV